MKKLKVFRSERGLSQFALAAAAKLPRWRIAYIELGYSKPSASEVTAIAKALGVSEAALA